MSTFRKNCGANVAGQPLWMVFQMSRKDCTVSSISNIIWITKCSTSHFRTVTFLTVMHLSGQFEPPQIPPASLYSKQPVCTHLSNVFVVVYSFCIPMYSSLKLVRHRQMLFVRCVQEERFQLSMYYPLLNIQINNQIHCKILLFRNIYVTQQIYQVCKIMNLIQKLSILQNEHA